MGEGGADGACRRRGSCGGCGRRGSGRQHSKVIVRDIRNRANACIVANDVDLELGIDRITNEHGPIVVSRIRYVVGDPAQTTIAGLISDRYRIDIGSRIPGDPVDRSHG